MGIITLTTDLGGKDYYVPLVKGYLLKEVPGAAIVDITHLVEPFNIAEASFLLGNCYAEFPPGTIHLVSVDGSVRDGRIIAVKYKDSIFIAHDNGLVALFLEDGAHTEIVRIEHREEDLIYPLRHIMAPAAVRLLQGASFQELGQPIESYRMKANLLPVIEEDFIRGTVIFVDNLGNAITNIRKSQVERYGRGRSFEVELGPRSRFTRMHNYYHEVPPGEKVALYSGTGYIEIAINQGDASRLLGLKKDSKVMVRFLNS